MSVILVVGIIKWILMGTATMSIYKKKKKKERKLEESLFPN